MKKQISTFTNDLQDYFDNYIKWLKDKTCFQTLDNGYMEITTPHLDRHNDCIQFYIKQQDNGGLLFTDGGYIIDDLEASGVTFSTPKRQKILNEIANGFGVTIINNQIEMNANATNFPVKKNNFIQAMLAINDMFALASSSIASLFFEDVEAWLDLHDVRYTPLVKFTGKSGFDFHFDFVIPHHKQHPERVLQTINTPTKSNIEQLLFSWQDTKDTRRENSTLFAVLNDVDHKVSTGLKSSLEAYNVRPLLWTARNNYIEEISA